ncbi:hypothetical protein HWV62_19855 [Athelia sp. TMB]|nr:hypothetical protein HWV62_19855 [Athelia sp. TMB]
MSTTYNTNVAEPFPTSRHPPKDDSDKQALQAFFGPEGAAHPASNIGKLIKLAEALKADGVKNVGAYGFCWGAKICISAGAEGTPLSSVAMVHPAQVMLSAEDAEKLTVPLAMYISKDESADEARQYNKINAIIAKKPFASKSDSKNYENMFHGFGSARADLKNEDNKKEFEDVYGKLATFFSNTL